MLKGVETVILDLDGTLYDKRGLAARMVSHLWWCLPLLAAERSVRRNMHYVQFASEEEFFECFFRQMARGHLFGPKTAERWYHRVYMPTMVRLIGRTCRMRPETMAIIAACKEAGIKMAIYSDYGCVAEKLNVLNVDSQQFDLLISAPQLGALKPAECSARQVLELMNADPKTTLFVGDREDTDGASAKAVGARFYLIR